MKINHWISLISLFACLVVASTAAFLNNRVVLAKPTTQDVIPPGNLSIADEECLACHSEPGQMLPLENGDFLDLFVSPDEYAASVHGQMGYACVQCHTTVGLYPHPPFIASDRRDASLQLYESCQRCHQSQYDKASDSVHDRARVAGNR
jgi:hypothetical protein